MYMSKEWSIASFVIPIQHNIWMLPHFQKYFSDFSSDFHQGMEVSTINWRSLRVEVVSFETHTFPSAAIQKNMHEIIYILSWWWRIFFGTPAITHFFLPLYHLRSELTLQAIDIDSKLRAFCYHIVFYDAACMQGLHVDTCTLSLSSEFSDNEHLIL